MSNYTMYGYKTPKGIDSAIKVKDLQKKLGVSADGIWGPKTQAAYESKQSGSASLYGASAAKGLGDTALLSSKAMRPYGAKAEGSSMLLEDSETRAQIASLRSMKETKPKKTDYGADSSTGYNANYSAAADAPAPSKTYTPPLNIRRPDQIRTMQRIMGVRDDGVWGPKTQAAYEAWHEKNTSSNYGETAIQSASQPQPFVRESETPSLTPPLNIRRPDQIKTMQRIVGVKDDGVWGPKTQAAYEAWSERIKEREGTQNSVESKGNIEDTRQLPYAAKDKTGTDEYVKAKLRKARENGGLDTRDVQEIKDHFSALGESWKQKTDYVMPTLEDKEYAAGRGATLKKERGLRGETYVENKSDYKQDLGEVVYFYSTLEKGGTPLYHSKEPSSFRPYFNYQCSEEYQCTPYYKKDGQYCADVYSEYYDENGMQRANFRTIECGETKPYKVEIGMRESNMGDIGRDVVSFFKQNIGELGITAAGTVAGDVMELNPVLVSYILDVGTSDGMQEFLSQNKAYDQIKKKVDVVKNEIAKRNPYLFGQPYVMEAWIYEHKHSIPKHYYLTQDN